MILNPVDPSRHDFHLQCPVCLHCIGSHRHAIFVPHNGAAFPVECIDCNGAPCHRSEDERITVLAAVFVYTSHLNHAVGI